MMANQAQRRERSGGQRLLAVGLLTVASILASSPTLRAQAKKPAGGPPTVSPSAVLASEQVKYINELLDAQWKANKLRPSAPCTDYDFIRRASLDIIGRIARIDEIERFMKDPPAIRRAALIERLLSQTDSDGKNEWATYWANNWSIWLVTRSGTLQYREQLRDWLYEHLAKGGTHREMVTQLLTAEGKNTANGAVNYVLSHVGEPVPANKRGEEGQFEMVPVTARTTRLFLGFQTQCTQCHDHPFNPEWTQRHFWGVNAFFRQVERVGTPLPANKVAKLGAAELELKDNTSYNQDGIVYYERRNGVVLPTKSRFLDGKVPEPGSKVSRREMLAQLVVNHDHFAKAYINRIWGHMFGRGLNEQAVVDDFGEHNPVVHTELLDRLAKDWASTGGYDPKNIIRWICNSRAYNLSCSANDTNVGTDAEVFFSRMLLKAMGPEQLFESLQVATQAAKDDAARDRWLRSLTLNFGDDEGNEVSFNGTVVQALMLINGNDINNAIMSSSGTVGKAVRKPNPAIVMNDLFMAALNRPPKPAEITKIMAAFPMRVADRDATSRYHDLFWALINSSEFILNH